MRFSLSVTEWNWKMILSNTNTIMFSSAFLMARRNLTQTKWRIGDGKSSVRLGRKPNRIHQNIRAGLAPQRHLSRRELASWIIRQLVALPCSPNGRLLSVCAIDRETYSSFTGAAREANKTYNP